MDFIIGGLSGVSNCLEKRFSLAKIKVHHAMAYHGNTEKLTRFKKYSGVSEKFFTLRPQEWLGDIMLFISKGDGRA